jgi:hypothetical protein
MRVGNSVDFNTPVVAAGFSLRPFSREFPLGVEEELRRLKPAATVINKG